MSPIGEKILSYYPTQNYPGTVNNYVAGTGGKYRYEQPMGRWDHTIDDSNHLYTLFTFQDGSEYRNQTGIPGPAAAGKRSEDGGCEMRRCSASIAACVTRLGRVLFSRLKKSM